MGVKMFKIYRYTESVTDFTPLSGAVNTYNIIKKEGKLEELDFLLRDLFPGGISEMQLNDILKFESDWLFAQLDINNVIECYFCGSIHDKEDLEEDEDGSKLCPDCLHKILSGE